MVRGGRRAGRRVGHPANQEPDVATRATRAPTGGMGRKPAVPVQIPGPETPLFPAVAWWHKVFTYSGKNRASGQVVTQVVMRMHTSVAELAKYGIDAAAVLAEMDTAITEQTRVFIRDLRNDVAVILLGGIPESCRRAGFAESANRRLLISMSSMIAMESGSGRQPARLASPNSSNSTSTAIRKSDRSAGGWPTSNRPASRALGAARRSRRAPSRRRRGLACNARLRFLNL